MRDVDVDVDVDETTLSGDKSQSKSGARVRQKPNTNLTQQQPNLRSRWSHPGLSLDDSAFNNSRQRVAPVRP